MTQLVEGGFGVATLPRAAAERLVVNRALKVLKCTTPLQPLPVFASFRSDPSSGAVETVVKEVFGFIAAAQAPRGGARPKAVHRKNR
jgi:DNA-binding transcriptional LysR family regulator